MEKQRAQQILGRKTLIQLVIVLTIWGHVKANHESYKLEYFDNATLHCNFTLHRLSYPGLLVPFKKYWILPNATILPDTFISTDKYEMTNTWFDLQLVIRSIDDPDFGAYHCIMIWNNVDYHMDTVRVGLNEDGPYYQKQLEKFERNVIIGCSAAGGLVILVLVGCCVCHCMTRRKKHKEEDPVSIRPPSVYSVDYQSPKNHSRKHDYHIGDRAAIREETHLPETNGQDEDQYACVNSASISMKRMQGDLMTAQSAHL